MPSAKPEADLQRAAGIGDATTVSDAIAQGANVNHTDDNGLTALHLACYHGNLQVVTALLQAKADVHLTNHLGQTGLHLAASRGYLDVVKALCDVSHDVDMPTKTSSMTALHLAARGGHAATCEYLLNKGARRDAKDQIGKSAEFYAPNVTTKKTFAEDALKKPEPKDNATPFTKSSPSTVPQPEDSENTTPMTGGPRDGSATAVQEGGGDKQEVLSTLQPNTEVEKQSQGLDSSGETIKQIDQTSAEVAEMSPRIDNQEDDINMVIDQELTKMEQDEQKNITPESESTLESPEERNTDEKSGHAEGEGKQSDTAGKAEQSKNDTPKEPSKADKKPDGESTRESTEQKKEEKVAEKAEAKGKEGDNSAEQAPGHDKAAKEDENKQVEKTQVKKRSKSPHAKTIFHKYAIVKKAVKPGPIWR